MDAAAVLAAREAEYETLLGEERQIKNLETQKRELERLKVQKGVKATHARLEIVNHEMIQEASVHSADCSTRGQQQVYFQHLIYTLPIQQPTLPSPPQTDVTRVAQAVQNSIVLNRLPMPAPSVFTGDSIQLIE